MHLMKSTTSPYGRLAHAMLIESGAAIDVELLNPWADPSQLVALNPARRVPTLSLDDGTVLTEAMAIAMYATDIAPADSHLKTNTAKQYEVVGLSFGALEAAVHVMVGRKIVSDDLSVTDYDTHPVAVRRFETMKTALPRLDAMAERLRVDRIGLAEIMVANTVQYINFRFPGADWRPEIPNLDAWIARVADHPSIAETLPS